MVWNGSMIFIVHLLCQLPAKPFQILLVRLVERAEFFGVNIKYGTHLALSIKQRHHNLAARQRAARYVTGELLHVGYHLCAARLPCRAAHASSVGNVEAGRRSLKRSYQQFVVHHAVEARPEEAHRLVQGGYHITHHRHFVVFPLNECTHLWQQLFVLFLFCHHDAFFRLQWLA